MTGGDGARRAGLPGTITMMSLSPCTAMDDPACNLARLIPSNLIAAQGE